MTTPLDSAAIESDLEDFDRLKDLILTLLPYALDDGEDPPNEANAEECVEYAADEIKRLRAENEALRETLKRVKEATLDYVTFHGPSCEWHYDEPDDSCRACLIDKRMNAACAILEGK